jgi:hypothetical protein
MEGEGLDLDHIAASLRADAGDLESFAENLAVKLEQTLPGRVKVQRSRQGLLGPKIVRQIAVQCGDERLELTRDPSGHVDTQRSRTSGGIVLKRETVDTDEWLAALGRALAIEAQRSAQTRQALERLLLD